MRTFILGSLFILLVCRVGAAVESGERPVPGTHAHFAVLTSTVRSPAPFSSVDLVYGAHEQVGEKTYQWWELSLHGNAPAEGQAKQPLFRLRALTSRDPLAPPNDPLQFARYIFRDEQLGETLEYRTPQGGVLLPPWRDFRKHFVPRRVKGSRTREAVAESARYLGHVLSLRYAARDVPWEEWTDTITLSLDSELLVGTGRSFKDAEQRRLPQKPERQNYTYVPFAAQDYRLMIDTGVNLFTVNPGQTQWVRSEPVFYLRQADGNPPLSYPGDLYRSNYLGRVMFMDEPAVIMVGDKLIHDTLRYFSDAAALLQARIRQRYDSGGNYSAFLLESNLRSSGVSFGNMRLEQNDYPAWETLFETAYYQLRAGLAGIVHEGRYRLDSFDDKVSKWTSTRRQHTPGEMLRYHYAFLRGAARSFGKHWGMSIYGQCDPEISPLAMTLAYDMGARYIWLWTSDHDHHVPWPEQLELVQTLRAHAKKHPRDSIFGPRRELDLAVAIPYGFFLSLENLWWVRVLDPEGKSEAAKEYRRLMERAIEVIHGAMDRSEEFDVIVDEGRAIRGYKKVVQIDGKP